MKLYSKIKGCTKSDRIRNEDVQKYKSKWKEHTEDEEKLPLKTIKDKCVGYILPCCLMAKKF